MYSVILKKTLCVTIIAGSSFIGTARADIYDHDLMVDIDSKTHCVWLTDDGQNIGGYPNLSGAGWHDLHTIVMNGDSLMLAVYSDSSCQNLLGRKWFTVPSPNNLSNFWAGMTGY